MLHERKGVQATLHVIACGARWHDIANRVITTHPCPHPVKTIVLTALAVELRESVLRDQRLEFCFGNGERDLGFMTMANVPVTR